MRLVTVGTGTVIPDPERASACHWVEEAGDRLIIDCGAGALQGLARASLPWGEAGHLVISHFHADHIGEIPSLIFALRHGLGEPRTKRLDVWGPGGTVTLFRHLARSYGDWLLQPGFPVEIHEVDPGDHVRVGGLRLATAATPHTDESLALRITGTDAALGYTGDTGPDDSLADFFAAADVLLAECSLPDELVGENHLSPTRLGRIAAAAGVGRLVVTHVYPQLRGRDLPDLIRRAGYEGEIVLASDGMEIMVSGNSQS